MEGERPLVLVVSARSAVAGTIAEAINGRSGIAEAVTVTTLRAARRLVERTLPAVIVFDEGVLAGEPLVEVVRELARSAPVVAAVEPVQARSIAPLVAAGSVDCVPRQEGFRELAAALVERRLHARRAFLGSLEAADRDESGDFGSILRHELNNPLTGILGNAEMLLHRREELPEAAVARLETIADLAVRLREIIRRLSGAGEARLPEGQARRQTQPSA
jgi:signal transduction histidine kinase